ncbi:hypothetical protein B0H10DRAFT_589928 [Mycena sp. CBHHK59/15]|nr:hypothetical protein B0H10DRAFT_589928 [Mycena sp. CBHHK59/15]
MHSSSDPPHPPSVRKKLTKTHDNDMCMKDDKDGTRVALKRPEPPPHSSSFSKRHASFDSPREVPLPPSSLATAPQTSPMRQQIGPQEAQYAATFDDDAEWTLITPGPAKLHKGKDKAKQPPATVPATPAAPAPPPSSVSKPAKLKSQQSQQQLAASSILPYARPYSVPEAHSYPGRTPSNANAVPGPSAVDRTSSASLPLPTQIPFSVLPKARPSLPSTVLERPPSEALRPPLHPHSSAESSSSGSLPSAPGSRSPTPNLPPPAASTSASLPPPSAKSAPPAYPPRVAHGPALMPPPDLTMSHSGLVASYRPPRTAYTAPLRAPEAFPPPEPPVILPTAPDAPGGVAALAAETCEGEAGSRASAASTGTTRSSASYEPFLSHAPPPVDSWIEVETTQAEYRLIVRLPGFKRDGITLATKKRRILHVVADSWEEGGGHFERRISFGYDADLAQVRAEFDGELLRVIIPRRIPASLSAGGWGAPGPLGR